MIFGCLEESLDSWKDDLSAAIGLSPRHISAYSLTIEKGTVFGRLASSGKVLTATENDVQQMFKLTEDMLEEAGLNRYEISNFASPGFESIHNQAYWAGHSYLGIGAGAHSFLKKELPEYSKRWWNIPGPANYICLLYTSPSPRDATLSRMPSSA